MNGRTRLVSLSRIWTRALAPAALLLLIFASGCSFESSLSNVSCEQDGQRADGRVCQNGHWIAEADASLDADHGDATDIGPDVFDDAGPDADADAGCAADETMCSGVCVNTNTSEDHCGGCDNACNTYGQHSVALCAQGSCERTCEEGWIDANGDWIDSDDPTHSDGCEQACSPTNGGVEICDTIDNDCNGVVDDGLTTTYYLDADDDTYGVSTDAKDLCSPEGDYTATEAGDCRDDDASIHPDAEDTCDTVDNDCDGTTDPGCTCTNGDTQDCYNADPATKGVGPCKGGTLTCSGGSWGSCDGQVVPDTEQCNGVDDDCDGQKDEGVKTTYYADSDGDTYGDPNDTIQACSPPNGYVSNQNDCDDTDADVHPGATEMCNDADDDCDTQIDEGFPDKGASCSVGQGICEASGTMVCKGDGTGTTCDATPGTPDATENCNDTLDNTCDGVVNETCPCLLNGDSAGVCGQATRNAQGICQHPDYESDETTCDGKDNDCDGSVDEGFANLGDACTTGVGACESSGIYVCTTDGSSTTCDATAGTPSTEDCTNGIDDDCDGNADCADTADCSTGTSCGSGSSSDICYNSACCVPDTKTQICTGRCGNNVELIDNCGQQRTLNCGSCNCNTDGDCPSTDYQCNPYGRCELDSCNNGVQDNYEGCVDGGGFCFPQCSGAACNNDWECASNNCNNNTCQ